MSRRKQALVLLLLSAAVVFFVIRASGLKDQAQTVESDVPRPSPPISAADPILQSAPVERASEPPREALSGTAHLELVEIRGRVFDTLNGEPLHVSIECLELPSTRMLLESAADGAFEARCVRGRNYRFSVRRNFAHWGTTRDVGVDSVAEPAVVELGLVPRRSIPVVFLTPKGEAFSSVARSGGGWAARETYPSLVVTSEALGDSVAVEPVPLRVGRFPAALHGETATPENAPLGYVGQLELLIPPPVYCHLTLGDRILQRTLLSGEERQITFVIDPSELGQVKGSVALRALDADTLGPLATRVGLTFCAVGDQGSKSLFEVGEDGRFERDDVPAGKIQLRLEFSGYEYESRQVQILAGRRNDLGDILIRRSACIEGRVVSPTGKSVEAKVWCSVRGDRAHLLGGFSHAPSQLDWFAVCSIPRSVVWLGVDAPGCAVNPVEVDASSGSVKDMRLIARAGCKLKLDGPDPSTGAARIEIEDARGQLVWSGDNLDADAHEVCLLPGPYHVHVRHANGKLSTIEAELSTASNAALTLP